MQTPTTITERASYLLIAAHDDVGTERFSSPAFPLTLNLHNRSYSICNVKVYINYTTKSLEEFKKNSKSFSYFYLRSRE